MAGVVDVGEDLAQDVIDDLVGRAELFLVGAGLAWMPMPTSISSSPSSKPGLPAAGTVHGRMATPMVRTLSMTFCATRCTSSSSAPCSAFAPATAASSMPVPT